VQIGHRPGKAAGHVGRADRRGSSCDVAHHL
jgi:hypothetical protein